MSQKHNTWVFIQQFLFFFAVISFLHMLLGYLGLTSFFSRYSPEPLNAIDAPFAQELVIPKESIYAWDNQGSTIYFDKEKGNVVEYELKDYSILKDGEEPIRTLFQNENGSQSLAEQLLFIDNTGAQKKPEPLKVVFHEMNKTSLKVEKHYAEGAVLEIIYESQNPYCINKQITIVSSNPEKLKTAYYSELRNTGASLIAGTEKGFRMFQGASFHTEQTKYAKYPFLKYKNTAPFSQRSAQGWFSVSQRYFVSAHKNNFFANYYSRYFENPSSRGEVYVAGAVSDLVTLDQGQSVELRAQLYSGPEDKVLLTALDPALPYVIDFGVFWPVCNLLLSGLTILKNLLGDWGLSIIFLTLGLRTLILILSLPHQDTLRKLQNLAPKQEKLRKQITDDLAYNKALLDLHRQEKINYISVFFATIINPLIQIPVLFGFYSLLMESVVLRHASFLSFISDLSSADTSYTLAVLLLVSALAQQRVSPKISNPDLALMLGAMPYVFAVLSLTFPSGLVLYWIINNTFSLIQEGYNRFSYGISRSTQ